MIRPNPSPFFLVGAVRSGTTLLRLLLGHHPQICRCDEFEYVADAIAGREQWPEVGAYAEQLSRRRDFRATGFRANTDLPFPDLARDLLDQCQLSDGRPIIGATVHNHFDELLRLWPSARFIHLNRDPRDIARSCVEMGWSGNAWAGIETWNMSEDAWQRVCQQVPADRRLEVEFEDLTTEPEGVLRRITAFLGVEYDAAMMEIEKDTTYRRPSKRASRSWRDDASELEIRQMESRLGDRLVKAGYAASGLPHLEISPLQAFALRQASRYGRFRFAMRRYGTALWLSSLVSRRLIPISAWRNSTQLALDRIDEGFLK